MEKLRTIEIKGKGYVKEYVEVNERIRYFREKYPEWSINTKWIHIDANMAICQCDVIDENGVIRSQGTAQELKGNGFINKTSHVENCETSAVGRALGILGIGIETSVASYEEVATAINTQNQKNKSERKKATSKKFIPEKSKDICINRITKGFEYLGTKIDKPGMMSNYLSSPENLYDNDIKDLNKLLKALEEKAKGNQ